MDGNGAVVYLTGSHTWANFQDNGNGNPPAAFDYGKYLDFLAANNHNFFRLWTWEQSRWTLETGDENYWFNPEGPYVRTGPGTALDGKAKWDLSKFDQGYFDRMRQRVVAAGQRGMYVSIMLFDGWSVVSNQYPELNNPWKGHPYNSANNINGINGDGNGDNNGREVHTLATPAVTALQEAYVKKVVDTLNDLDNVLYEIANEAPDESLQWQYHLVDMIHTYEAGKAKQHPVGMTGRYEWSVNDLLASGAEWISPGGSAYQWDPPPADGQAVVIVDTDHLWGIGGDYVWVWKSFTRGLNPIFMDGYDGAGYGVGGQGFNFSDPTWVKLRANLGYTRAYAQRMNLAAMTPRGDLCSTGYCLANAAGPGAEFIVYQPNGANAFTVKLNGLSGSFAVEWLNPENGNKSAGSAVSGGGTVSFTPPFANAVLYLKQPGGPTPTPIPPTPTATETVAPPTATPTALPHQLEVTTSVVGKGSVTVVPPGTITCGQLITITAIPEAGWSFIGWTGDILESDNPLVENLYGSLNLVANFSAAVPEFIVAAQIQGNGDLEIRPGGPYRSSQVVEITALANPGWRFDSWQGTLQGSDNPVHLQILQDMAVTAKFLRAKSLYLPSINLGRTGQATGPQESCQ
jgi:hypothetical protein